MITPGVSHPPLEDILGFVKLLQFAVTDASVSERVAHLRGQEAEVQVFLHL